MFRTIKKHEIILEQALVELCRILLRLGNTAMNAGLNEGVEISIDFDDSIIEDKQTDFSRDMQLLQAGIMNDWEFRMKWMNEDESTAKGGAAEDAGYDNRKRNGGRVMGGRGGAGGVSSRNTSSPDYKKLLQYRDGERQKL